MFPGGALIGDTAGFLNVPKIKGTHTAMKSGMVAAEAAFDALKDGARRPSSTAYPERLEAELALGRALAACATSGPRSTGACGRPWPIRRWTPTCCAARRPGRCAHKADHTTLKPAADAKPIEYPRPDGKLTFDKLSSVFLSNTNHEEDQPAHLRLQGPERRRSGSTSPVYDGPEQRYCPAGVYEYVAGGDGERHLQINAQNCVHCKTCDIKDPTQNIDWVTPEGGGGPNYIGGM